MPCGKVSDSPCRPTRYVPTIIPKSTFWYGRKEFADYIDRTYNPLTAVFRLASETGSVVLNGDGFDGPRWSIRVSLANLDEADYVRLGQNIRKILDQFADEWKSSDGAKQG